MRTLAELAEQGLRGKALTDALYKDVMGWPPPAHEPTPDQRQRSWEEFFSLMDTFSPEELNDGFMDHRSQPSAETDSNAA